MTKPSILIEENKFKEICHHIVMISILDSGGVVTVEDGVDGLGDEGREARPLLPLLQIEVHVLGEADSDVIKLPQASDDVASDDLRGEAVPLDLDFFISNSPCLDLDAA